MKPLRYRDVERLCCRYQIAVGGSSGIAIELLDLAGISSWIDRVEHPKTSSSTSIQILIRSISHDFAALVAEDPTALDHLEWRDLERMMHRVMQGLGFDVELTPPAKDGGKDLILTCVVRNQEQSYIVELKHWRSGKRVGASSVSDFLQVIVSENRAGGLFLSTSGYASNAFEGVTEITRQKVKIGGSTKIVSLAREYMRAASGLWTPPEDLPTLLAVE